MTPFRFVVAALLVALPAAAQLPASGPQLDSLLRRLEEGKWHPASIGGAESLAALYADDFTTVEYGADPNGAVERKAAPLRALLATPQGRQLVAMLDQTPSKLTEWKFLHPAPGVVLASYRVTTPALDWTAYATSMWVLRDGRWQTTFYQASRAKPSVDTTAVGRMKRFLRNAATAQEAWFADQGTYAGEPNVIRGLATHWITGLEDVRFEILQAGPRGWAGRTTVASLPGRSCVVWVGDTKFITTPPTTTKDHSAGKEGEVACDAP